MNDFIRQYGTQSVKSLTALFLDVLLGLEHQKYGKAVGIRMVARIGLYPIAILVTVMTLIVFLIAGFIDRRTNYYQEEE